MGRGVGGRTEDRNDKRTELEESLASCDRDLRQRFGQELFAAGYCLVLGRHYAESPYVYFSLNPGFARDGSPQDPSSRGNASSGESNVPFVNPEALRKQYVYLHNCERFLGCHAALSRWMNDKVTSAFLAPWRTRNASDLYKLNHRTDGRLFGHAGQLATQIVRHHQARVLILAGKSSLTLLHDLGLVEAPIGRHIFSGPGGSYQWSRSETAVGGRAVTILQIPHFSRANSVAKMRELGCWLGEQLSEFGCGTGELAER